MARPWASENQLLEITLEQAAKIFSETEHVAGGKLTGGLAVHTTDGGKTYVTKGAGVKVPMMITAMMNVRNC